MSLDLFTIKGALQAWVNTQGAGVVAVWRNEARPFTPKARALLNIIASGSLGVDQLRWAQDTTIAAGEDFVPTVSGNRLFTLSILVQSRDQRPECEASWYLEKLRTSLHKPSVQDAFRAAKIAYQTTEPLQPLDETRDDRVESIAQLDVHFGAAVNERDTDEGGSFVERVEVTGNLTTPGGDNVGWVDEEFGKTA